LRTFSLIFLIALAGLALGGFSAWYSIQQSHRFGAISIGPWIAFPHAGAQEIDPYTVARAVAEGTVPLGATEGLVFEAVNDSQGRKLSRTCDYRIEGATPPAKIWTLVAYGPDGKPAEPSPGGRSSTYSNLLLHFPDGTFLLSMSQQPKPGNWLSAAGTDAVRLVLRLYDTPITSSAGNDLPLMPQIVLEGCR
jgi:hypothetical protein